MSAEDVTISATEFKAKCLGLLDDIAAGRLHRIRITKRGRVVGEVGPPAATGDIIGSMRGMARLPVASGLVEPLDMPQPDDPFLGESAARTAEAR